MKTTTASDPSAPHSTPPEPRTGGMRRVAGVLVALALAWLVPAGLYAVHASIVLPLIFFALVASLLRSGRTILDRLVLAVAMSAGAMCLAGLVFSIWPWGLHPVPISGVAFTVAVLVAEVTGRRPELPRRNGLPDLITLGVTALVTVATLLPLMGRGLVGRLSTVAIAEDLGRHFALFDNIRTHGGYTFQHQSELKVSLNTDMSAYPQGSHFAMGLFDNFLRARTDPGSTVTELNVFLFCYVATFVFLVFTVLWAMRWMAGGTLSTWRYLVVGAAAGAYLFFGDGIAMFMRGFPSEFVGLGLLALLVAVVCRPLRRLREQLCVLSSLTIAVSFTYYLFLPAAGVMLIAWMVGYRKQLWAQRWWTGVAIVVTMIGALVEPMINWKYASKSEVVNAAGGINPIIRHLFMLLIFLVVLGLVSRTAWRHPVRRMAILWMIVAGGAAMAMFAYQTWVMGETSYYYEKLLHQAMVVGIVCLGAGVLVAPRRRPGRDREPFTRPLSAGLLALCVVVTIAFNASPDREVWRKPQPEGTSWGVGFLERKLDYPRLGQLILAAQKANPRYENHATIIQMSDDWQGNYYGTLWLDVLMRNLALSMDVKPPVGSKETPQELTERIVNKFPKTPFRVYTDDWDTATTLQVLRRNRPDLGVDVLFSNPTRCTYDFRPMPVLGPREVPGPMPTIGFPANGCKSAATGPGKTK
ncbi:hypothetical protein [Embleya sp. NPDC050493]|uniref:hypothetical protein n=1 Tax=Embleya sp. NPDC050493 TaxID=3363989 RepID=UPI0037AC8D07